MAHFYELATASGQRPSALLGLEQDTLGALALDEALMLYMRGLRAWQDSIEQARRNRERTEAEAKARRVR